MKFNWRYANFEVFYKKPAGGSIYRGSGRLTWLTPTGAQGDEPYTQSFVNDVGENQNFGMPNRVFQLLQDDTYAATVQKRENAYSPAIGSQFQTRSYIYGCWHPATYISNQSYWVPFHIFYFYIPLNYPVTYQRITPTPEGYDDAFGVTVEGVWGGEVTVNPRTKYPQPEYPPY